MQLLWLTCYLAVVTAIPLLPSSPFIRTRRTANTINDTKADPDHNNHESQKPQICDTVHCHEIAKQIQQSIDTTVNPCENFYQYACGSWGKNNPIPEGMNTWSQNHVVLNRTESRIKELLEEPISSTDIPPVRMVKEFYRSCMDVDAIEKRGFEPIQEILNRTGGWPMAMPVSEWNEIPWQKIDSEYMSPMQINNFYSISYDIDPNDRKRYILTVGQIIEDSPSKKRDPIEAYMADIKYIANISARQNGYTLDENQLTSDVTEMVHFELLTEITVKHLSTGYYDIKKIMTIEELQKYYNNFNITAPTAKIDFLEIIQLICNEANIHVNSSEPIIVYNPKFLHEVATLLGNTTQRTLVNYIQWNMVKKFMSYTTQEMRNIKFATSENFTDTIPRWRICLHDLEMKNAISYMFVKKYMPDYTIHEVMEVVKDMKEEIRNHLERTHWLPSSIKLDMLQKTDNYGIEIGYPEWYKNDDAVTRYYDGLSIGSDYFQNILNAIKKKLQKLGILRQVVKKSNWVDYPTTYNSYYSPEINTIFILATQLQDPYFTPRLPDAIKYGGRGFVIGHELGHAFDRTGIEFDKDGNKIPWKSHNVSKEYDQRAKCFIDQYSNYILHISNDTKEDIKLNGTITNDEDIADSVAVRIAYSAYKKAEKENIQSKLPGLEDISNDKLFFLSSANYWCSTTKSGYDENIEFDEHSPSKYRIVGAMSNMAAFSEAFNCPQNSFMNRQHKCTLWD